MSIEVHSYNGENLRRSEIDIVTALTDPEYQGSFHLKEEGEIKPTDIPFNYPLFADNYGFVHGSAGMTILQDGEDRYKIIHLTDNPLMFSTRDCLMRNQLKLMDGGTYFLLNSSSGKIMKELGSKGYVPRDLPTMREGWNFRREMENQIQGNINPDFVQRVSKFYLNGHFKDRKEDLERELRSILRKPHID